MSAKDQAQRDLSAMQKSLAEWLRLREASEAVANGTAKGLYPPATAKLIIDAYRDKYTERRLAAQLRVLLAEVYDPTVVPLEDLDAPALARIVVTGQLPTASTDTPQTQGIAPLLLLVTLLGTGWMISSILVARARGEAEVARENARAVTCRLTGRDCVESSAWKWIAIGGIAWFLLGDEVKHWFGLAQGKVRRSRAYGYISR